MTVHRLGTMTFSPVRGLRAWRAFRHRTSKTPKLRSSTRPSLTSVFTMASNSIMNDLAGLELCKAKLLGNHSDDVFPGHESILLPRNCGDAAARRCGFV